MAKFISKILKKEKIIPTFFYDATRYIEKELKKERSKTYDISGVDMQQARELLNAYGADVEVFRETNVAVAIAALKIKCQEQGKNDLLTTEDVSNIVAKTEKWLKVAKEILEKKPLVVLLLRHFVRVLADKDLFPVNLETLKSWQISGFLICRDGTEADKNAEQVLKNAEQVLIWLIGFIDNHEEMKFLEPKGIPRFIVDFISYIEKPRNIRTHGIYRLSGLTSQISEVKAGYDANGAKILKDHFFPAVTTALRRYIQEVDIIDPPTVEALVSIKQKNESKLERVAKFRAELRKIPFFKLNILIYFINHLHRVSLVANKMDTRELAKYNSPQLGNIKKTKVPDETDAWTSVIQDLIEEPDLYF